MEGKLDNLLCSRGFRPNSCNKVSKYLNLEGNPFTKLANITDDAHRVSATIEAQLLYYKMINCNKHRVQALMLNADVTNNHWRLLEILYHYLFNIYGKHLQLWNTVTTELKDSFHKGIKNELLGKNKVDMLTYSILINIFTYVKYNIERNFSLLKDDISWENIYGLFLNIIALFPNEQYICTCNDYINYPISFLKQLSYIRKDNLENILNNVPLDYESKDYKQKYINDINEALKYKIPKPKTIGNIKLSYDFIPENYRIDFIHSVIKDYSILNKIYDIENETYEIFRTSSKCFICDVDVTEILYNTHIKNGEICEQISKNKLDRIYPITHRCLRCRQQSYHKLLKSNNDFIMARHYKWMIFYLGHQTSSLYLPKEILLLIIIKYLNIRCI